MIILPAIDLKDGCCVRLTQGDFATVAQVANDPLETALSFAAQGAHWLHMVDLDGALQGRGVNGEIALRIAKETPLRVELGGGIRSLQQIDRYLQGGIARVVLGSAVLENPALLTEAVREFGDAIAVGIDAKHRKVATRGWLDVSEIDYLELSKRMEDAGVETIIYTDISKDGTLQGPSLQQLQELQTAVCCDIIASGGVGSLEDVQALCDQKLYGAICGKAVYTGAVPLDKAILIGGEQRC